MSAAAILNYYFVTPDHPRSPFVVLNLPFKFCIDRVYTFRDIAIWKFHKFSLKCLFRPPKIMSPKLYFLSSRLPKGTSVCRNTRFEPSLVVIWCDLDARQRVQKKKEPKVSQNLPFLLTPFSSLHIDQILHAGSYPGYLSWFWVSERSVENVGAVGVFEFLAFHWLGTSLIQQLVATAQPWYGITQCYLPPDTGERALP